MTQKITVSVEVPPEIAVLVERVKAEWEAIEPHLEGIIECVLALYMVRKTGFEFKINTGRQNND